LIHLSLLFQSFQNFIFISVSVCISGYKNAQTVVDVDSMHRMQATKFKEAGLGAVPKTYPYDPTKLQKTAAIAKAKSKNV